MSQDTVQNSRTSPWPEVTEALRERLRQAFTEYWSDDENIHEDEFQFAAFLLQKFGVNLEAASAPDLPTAETLPEVTPKKNTAVGVEDRWPHENTAPALWFLENRDLLAHALAVAGNGNPAGRIADARDARRYRVLRSPKFNGFPGEGQEGIGLFQVSQKTGPSETEYLGEAWLDEAVDEYLRNDPGLPGPRFIVESRNCSTYATAFEKRHHRRPTAHEYFMAGVREGRMRGLEESRDNT